MTRLIIAAVLVLVATAAQADTVFTVEDAPITDSGTWAFGKDGCTKPDKSGGRICIQGYGRSWHLLTQSYGGTVSLIKDLTKEECEDARKRVMPGLTITNFESTGITKAFVAGDIKSAECFQ